MIWVFVGLAAVSVFVVAAVAVGREASRLGHQLPATVFDLHEAVAQVSEALPFEAQARLSYDDVRTIIAAALDHLRERGVLGRPGEDPAVLSASRNGIERGAVGAEDEDSGDADDDEDEDADVVVADQEALALVLGQVEAEGRDLDDEDVYAVMSALHRHLTDIGAVGPTA